MVKLAQAVIISMLRDYKDRGERVDEVLFTAVSERMEYLEKENNQLVSENIELRETVSISK
ncbi:hypothetical protein ACM26V_00260 [Salipaludibacillus sp. HK11]|uniref:hypothetical protein n=1 Tax=Salipaludibacillus sp. HK11 TaxID=3394320 RepID=UPI0039FCAD3F